MDNSDKDMQVYELRQKLTKLQEENEENRLAENRLLKHEENLHTLRRQSERVYENLAQLFSGTELMPYVEAAIEENRSDYKKQLAGIENARGDIRRSIRQNLEDEERYNEQIRRMGEE